MTRNMIVVTVGMINQAQEELLLPQIQRYERRLEQHKGPFNERRLP